MVVPDFVKHLQSSDSKLEESRKLSGLEKLDVSDLFEVEFVLKGDEDPDDLEYELILNEWTPTNIDIKVNFSNPEMISTGPSSDSMKIKIKNAQIFRSESSGDQLPGSMAIQTSEVPPQLPPGITEEMMKE